MATSSVSSGRLLTRAKGRDKPQLSCDFCKRRKLRCDRKQPCQSCTRLGQASTCSFPSAGISRSYGNEPENTAKQTIFQQRIDHLETLVRTLAAQQQDVTTPVSTPESTAPSETGIAIDNVRTLSHDFGRIRLKKGGSSYVESDHWMAILDEISDLKNMASEDAQHPHDQMEEEQQPLPGADLFFLHTFPATKTEIIAALPPRHVADSIIARYFKTADMPVTLILHRRVFFKQYEKFWEDPLEASVMWIAILFGMMFIVAYSTLFINPGGDPMDEGTLMEYQKIVIISREKIIQSLRLGNYMKGVPHTIEALLFFLQTEYVQGEDAQQGCWQLIGTIVRVAQKMGYHRDGKHFPELSPFEAEMRRRTWYMLLQFDIASASLVGLPRTIKEAQCDTAEPHNLLDDDFDDTITALPPSRPVNEHTLAQFLIHKSRVVSIYGMICDFTTSSKHRDYNETMRLDNLLRTAYNQKPPILELKPVYRSIMDGTELITRRLYIAMTFYHAQITLHRKFMILAKSNSRYSESYRTCMDAALVALQLQAEIFEHTQPGRMLHSDRWKILALIQSEFLLATVILCYDLDDEMTNAKGRSPVATLEDTQRSVTALQTAQDIWKKQQDFSKEAHTAVKAIDAVLDKAQHLSGFERPNPVPLRSRPVANVSTSSAATGQDETNAAAAMSTVADHPVESHSTFQFVSSIPQAYESQDTLLSDQSDFSSGSWNEFFDLDRFWDTWMQI